MRWLAAVVLAPMLMLGALGGTTFLAHKHDGHGLHLHAADTAARALLSAADHRAAHRVGDCAVDPEAGGGADQEYRHSRSPSSENGPLIDDSRPGERDQAPDGLLVSLPDHEQLPTRGIDLSKNLTPAVVSILAELLVRPPPDLDRRIGSPGGLSGCGPLDLSALSAGDRLVRTSHALLI